MDSFMNRRIFLQLFAATTAAILTGPRLLTADTSTESTCFLQRLSSVWLDQWLWIVAQQLRDYGEMVYTCAAQASIGGTVYPRGFPPLPSVQQYHDHLLNEYNKVFGVVSA